MYMQKYISLACIVFDVDQSSRESAVNNPGRRYSLQGLHEQATNQI